MELSSHIHSLPAQPTFYTGPQAPNVFLVCDSGEGALIDSGFGDEKSVQTRLEFLRERADVKVRQIVLTHHHFDHSSGAHQLREATGARVSLHDSEVVFLKDWQSEAPQDSEAPPSEDEKDIEYQKKLAERMEGFRNQAPEAGADDRVSGGDKSTPGRL